MPKDGALTRQQIVAAADELFYSQGLHNVSVDAISAKAGVTKKTFYYHFESKDELIASYLDARDRPTFDRFKNWAGEDGTAADKVERLFGRLGRALQTPTWAGCGFMRVAAELANMPGHPALDVARLHKGRCEQWFAGMLRDEGHPDPDGVARALIVLLDGAVSQMLIHRNEAYAFSAGRAAVALVGGKRAEG